MTFKRDPLCSITGAKVFAVFLSDNEYTITTDRKVLYRLEPLSQNVPANPLKLYPNAVFLLLPVYLPRGVLDIRINLYPAYQGCFRCQYNPHFQWCSTVFLILQHIISKTLSSSFI